MATCSVQGCEEHVQARGWCDGHYKRWRRGAPIGGPLGKRSQSLEEQMRNHVQVTGFCWLWQGSSIAGYGQLSANGRNVRAHRAVYGHLVGPIPAGLFLDHLCRVPACVNPDHLEPVTNQENVRRGIEARLAPGRDWNSCPRGHEYTVDNTYTHPNGRPVCRSCGRDRHYAKKTDWKDASDD